MHRTSPHTDPTRRTATVAGVLYLLTFASSIPAALLLAPVLTNPAYVAGAGADAQVAFASVLDLVNGFAAIGTAVALFSVLRRQHEGFALGFVTTRLFEAAVLAIGVVGILGVVTLRQAVAAGADAATLVGVGQGLVAVRDWAFIIGTGMASFNAMLLGTLLFRSRLVPRAIPALGLIGAPLFLSFVVANILGLAETGTAYQGIAVAPIFIWELVLGLWMTFKGFNRAAPIVLAAHAREVGSSGPAIVRASLSEQAGAA